MLPTVGAHVLYKLSAGDVEIINHELPVGPFADGHARRNAVYEGRIYPAQVVATFGGDVANLIVQLDGYGQYWATSRAEGDAPSQWVWPPREAHIQVKNQEVHIEVKNRTGADIINALCKEIQSRGGNVAEVLGPLVDREF